MANDIGVTEDVSGKKVATQEITGPKHVQKFVPVGLATCDDAEQLGKKEDDPHVSGEYGILMLVVRRDTASHAVSTDNDRAALAVNSEGRLWVSSKLDTALPTGTNVIGVVGIKDIQTPAGDSCISETANAVRFMLVDSSGTVVDPGVQYDDDVVDTTPTGVPVMWWDVSGGNKLKVASAAKPLPVSVVSLTGDVTAIGKAAHDAAVSGNPVRGGLRAFQGRRTAVGADDRVVDTAGDRYGRQTVVVGSELKAKATQLTASGAGDILAATDIGASTRALIYRIEASNSHASNNITVGLKHAGLNGGSTFGKKYLPAAGGQATWTFPQGVLRTDVNTAFQGDLSGTGQIEFTVYYELVAN